MNQNELTTNDLLKEIEEQTTNILNLAGRLHQYIFEPDLREDECKKGEEPYLTLRYRYAVILRSLHEINNLLAEVNKEVVD